MDEADKANLIEAYVAAERQGLRNLMQPYHDRIAWGEARVLWDRDALHAIRLEAQTQHVDLLIKPAGSHSLRDYLMTPLDWRLIRDAPCPVLTSNSAAWQTGGIVLAAVDATDRDHEKLSEQVLRRAHALAQTLNAQLHVCCVYSDLGQSMSGLQVAMDYQGIKRDMRETRAHALGELLQHLQIDPAEQHILEGKPGRTIAHLSEQLNATVTVLGTAARKGLSKLVLGNTAEDVLNHIRGDVLTLRD